MNSLLAILLPFLIIVESNGKDNAIGDNGKAHGCLQIWDVVVSDVNEIYGTSYHHDDMFDRAKSKKVATLYLTHWGKHYEKITKKKANSEVLARIWNGGPNGWKNANTKSYWKKVKKVGKLK